jgi:hypothetical protein
VSGGQFSIDTFRRNVTLVAVKMFSRLIQFIKTFCKLCSFNAICKDTAAKNVITTKSKFDESHSVLVSAYVAVNRISIAISMLYLTFPRRCVSPWRFSGLLRNNPEDHRTHPVCCGHLRRD